MFSQLQEKLSPAHFKHFTAHQAISTMSIPSQVVLPLLQHAGKPAQPVVAVKDKVKIGTLLAKPQENFSAPIHASISGEVKAIENRPHPVLGEYPAIVIQSDGRHDYDSLIRPRQNVDALSKAQIIKIIRDCGIVGLGGAAFPTHIKLDPPKPVDTFIVNGAECEPFLTADHRLMLEKAKQILAGMEIVIKVLKVSSAYVAIESNKPDAIRLFSQLVKDKPIKVVKIKSFYPQGAEKQLIKTVCRREVPAKGLPFDVGVLVHNVATCWAIYQAVYENRPLYERVITVGGRIVKQPGNLLVSIGTKVQDILDACGGLTEPAAKVILGGPMMGVAQYTLEVPVIKGTSGIIVFAAKEVQSPADQATCIRCGHCLAVCPMGLNPSAIAQAVEKGRFDLAQEYHVQDCIECGICSYSCPGNRNIVALVKLAKEKLKQTDKHG